MQTAVTHVLFDLGNVIIRIHFDRCFHYWSEKTGLPAKDILKFFHQDKAYEQHERNEITGFQYYQHINQSLSGKLSYEDFVMGWNSVFGDTIAETLQFIQQNPNLKYYVLTNSNVLHREKWQPLYAQDLKVFSKIYCSSQIRCRKPEAKSFQLILDDLKIQPAKMVFVDDLLENVEGAKAVGLHGIHFANPGEGIKSLKQLITSGTAL